MFKLSYKSTILMSAVIATFALPAHAAQFKVGENGEASIMGSISQGMTYGLNSGYDTQHGLNSLITTVQVEGSYKPNNDFKFYGSLLGKGDWIYQARRNDDENSSWKSQGFSQSRKNLAFDDKYWQVMRELHVTWSSGNTLVRAGKQIVKWGEMDGKQIIDTINPLDSRRGFGDFEFETTVIPTWLIKTEYYPDAKPDWLQDLGIEYVLNPNADFIPTQPLQFGNNEGGIWGPNLPGGTTVNGLSVFGAAPIYVPSPGAQGAAAGISSAASAQISAQIIAGIRANAPPFAWPFLEAGVPAQVAGIVAGLGGVTVGPALKTRRGSDISQNIQKPSGTSGIEHALRVKTNIADTLVTLNYFYGREKESVQRYVNDDAGVVRTLANDGSVLEHHEVEGYYPRKQFVGFTLSRDITPLKASFLGGVSPILRLESLYAFDSTYSVSRTSTVNPLVPVVTTFEKSDKWSTGVGLDWKIKVPFLNPKNGIQISPQLFMDRYMQLPTDAFLVLNPGGQATERNNYSASLRITTSYMNNKLTPLIFVFRDINNRANWTNLELAYEPNDTMRFKVGGNFFQGSEVGQGFQLFANKDQFYANAAYKF